MPGKYSAQFSFQSSTKIDEFYQSSTKFSFKATKISIFGAPKKNSDEMHREQLPSVAAWLISSGTPGRADLITVQRVRCQQSKKKTTKYAIEFVVEISLFRCFRKREMTVLLLAVDHSAGGSMKNAVSCDN